MPKKTVENIYRYIHELILAGGDRSQSAQYGEYTAALSKLVDILTPYYKKDEQGNLPLIADADRRKIQSAYRNVIELGVAFLSKEKKDTKHIKQLTHVVTRVNEMLTAESVALTNVLSGDRVNIEQINKNAHSYMIDITNKKVNMVSGAQSSRIPVSFTKDGQVHEGFFTEESKFQPEVDMEKLLTKCSMSNGVVNPRYREFFDILAKNRGFQALLLSKGGDQVYLKQLDSLISDGNPDRSSLKGFFKPLIESIDPRYIDLAEEPDFSLGVFQFIKNYGSVVSKKVLNEEIAGINRGSSLEIRNAAFSAVADLLGISNAVARTVRMQVKDGDVVRDGIFMETANGYDVRNLNDSNPLTAFAQEDIGEGAPDMSLEGGISYKAVRDLANIQVLDFICGNVDRHYGNMLYSVNFKTGKIDGVQAIDNGSSFGRIKADDLVEDRNHLGSLSSFRTMSYATASHVLGLTPEVLRTTLRPFGLSEEEIDACIDRTKALQGRICFSMSASLKDRLRFDMIELYKLDDWKKMDVEYISDEETLVGTFLRGFCKAIAVNTKKQEKDRERKEFLDQIDESLMADSEAKYTSGDYYGTIPVDFKAEMKELKLNLQNAKKGFFIGTKKFDKVEDALDDVLKLESKPAADRSVKHYKALENKYKQLIARANYYIEKKEAKENELLRDGKVPSAHFNKRVAFVEKVALFAERQLEKTIHDRQVLAEKINLRRRMAEENIAFDWEIIPAIKKDPESAIKDRVLENLNKEVVAHEAMVKKIEGKEEDIGAFDLEDEDVQELVGVPMNADDEDPREHKDHAPNNTTEKTNSRLL